MRLISGRLRRPLQIQSWSRVSPGFEILGEKRDGSATQHHFIEDVQVGESAVEFIFAEPFKQKAQINS